MAWLWVAAIPIPSHSAMSASPALPSHGRSRTSSTKIVGSASPSGTAVVIIRSVTPKPLPKCLSPVTAYESPARNASASSGAATARVRLMSPPLPGSEVIVPHWSPATALANTARRCSSHAGWDGSGLASQNPMTGGMHGRHQRDRRVGRGQPAVDLAERTGRCLHALPEAARLDRGGGAEETGVPQPVEVGALEMTTGLPLLTVSPPCRCDLPRGVGDIGEGGSHRRQTRLEPPARRRPSSSGGWP